ncbi:transcriptional regulator, ArgR family [Ruminococcus sp. YE71]|uniref:arginine repressor n=1 Tax=unclassified Ruminococcus TaxID=2608920 RepID=UPI00089079C0|nr:MULTISPECIES: arginine repressor [unclassified Ruminococcus]SDA16996.1 transcriptional regulator, ArgR family [Ruminococcus sp. YE78]SFW25905.1 transcriptional regulator, ArgR family [Ruminococcus sp. YE71]
MKNKRQEMIVKLVSEQPIETQETLCRLLTEAGYKVTQATVSRDIKELALIKTQNGEGVSIYALPVLKREAMASQGSMIYSMIADSVRSVDYAMNTAVIRCASGMAQAICAKLDTTEIPSVVGTLAGDDTIFILMRTERDAERLVKELRFIIENKA